MKFNSIKRNLIIAIFIALTAIFTIAFTACTQSPQREEEKGEPQQLNAPTNFSIVDEKLCWDKVENADYYSVKYSTWLKRVSTNSWALPENTTGTLEIRIQACSNNERYLSSEWVSYNYVKTEPKPTSEIFGAFKYTLLEDGSGYEVARADMNSSSGLAGRVVIPDYFRGLPVKSIASGTFVLFEWVSMGAGYKEESRNSITTSVQLPVHLETIGSGAFSDCIALTSITIPDTVTSIGGRAFSGCTALTEINIPDTVTSIGSGAFSECSELSDIKLSENLQSLDNNAFHGTAWYKNQPDGFVTILDNILYCYKGEMAEGTVIDKLPSNIKYLAGGAFYECDKMVSINLAGVKFIGGYTFYGCTSLKSVTLPSDITEIPEFMFYNCTALETFTIPEGITKMGSSTFYGCTSLKSVTLPSGITEIPESMFYNCTALETFTIPEGITKIGSSTFYGCTSLKSVTLPSGITEIPKLMFSNCRALETVTIPEGVTLLETSAFDGCTKLKNIIIPSTVKTIMNNVFSSYMDSTEIYYKGTKEQWDSIEIRKTSTVTNILERVKKYFYSESEPADDGNYWHYVDGEAVVWSKE